MKHIFYKFAYILIAINVLWSCNQYEVKIPVKNAFDLSFERNGSTKVGATEKFNVVFKGSGEFVTLYTGLDSLTTWGNLGAKGVSFGILDSLEMSYPFKGSYTLTVVVTSVGKFGEEVDRNVLSKTVNVVDSRSTINSFKIAGIVGDITFDNNILFKVPDSWTDFNFAPEFSLASPLAKVFVMNGTDSVPQFTSVTKNDFNPALPPVQYIVKASDGTTTKYTVKFTTFVSSSEKKITKFVLKKVTDFGNGEVGVIDEANKTITVVANYGSNIKGLRLDIESSYASIILLNGTEAFPSLDVTQTYNIATVIKTIKVIAQDKSEQVYTLNVSQTLPVETFVLQGLIPAPAGVIDHAAKTITLNVLSGTDVTKLVPKWTGSLGKVMITGVVGNQVNGVSAVNFTTPKSYKFYSGTSFVTYVVTVVVK